MHPGFCALGLPIAPLSPIRQYLYLSTRVPLSPSTPESVSTLAILISASAIPSTPSSFQVSVRPPISPTFVTGAPYNDAICLLVSPGPAHSPFDALLLLDSILCVRVPTLQHIPKAARDSWVFVLSDALSAVVSNHFPVSCWCKLLMLAICVLANPPRWVHSHWRDTLKLVQSRIQKWKEDWLIGLWDDVRASIRGLVACTARVRSNPTSAEHCRHCNARRAPWAVSDGQFKKALQSLTSMGLALPTTNFLNEVLAKHPPAEPPAAPKTPTPPPVTVSAEQAAGALRSFPTGSAPVPSSLRANHLKEAVFCPSPSRANQSLLWLTKMLFHIFVVPLSCHAKKCGGLCPIAVGEVLHRLTSKCAAWSVL